MFKLLPLLVFIGCAGMYLKSLEKEKRSKVFIIKTGASKAKAYDKSLAYLAKNIGDSNHAIKLKDNKKYRVVAKILYPCEGLKRPDVITPVYTTSVSTNVDLAFKENRVRMEIEMISFTKNMGNLGGVQDIPISVDEGQEDAVSKCITKLKNKILNSINQEKTASDNW